MSHYAEIVGGVVTNVIVAEADFIATLPGTWVQTSYNTHGGVHYGADGRPDGGVALRKNYAGLGYVYDSVRDAFYTPQPSNLYQLNETTCYWEVKPEYTPLLIVNIAVSQVNVLPTGTPTKPMVIDGVSLYDKEYVLFTSDNMVPQKGVYQYNMITGILSYVDKTSSTIITPGSNTIIYQYVNNSWIERSI